MALFNKSKSYQALQTHYSEVESLHMRDLFAQDPERFNKFSAKACDIELDYSKNRITEQTMVKLFDLAREAQVEAKRDGMFAGDRINTSEDRAVLHTALRNLSGEPVMVEGQDVMPEVKATLAKIKSFVNEIHDGTRKGYTGKAFTDVLAIGIGGSFLGPKVMTEALKPYRQAGIKVHFVANVDGAHIHDVLATLPAESTLVVMSSKSFGTQETLKNTETAREWFLQSGGKFDDIAKHFVCVSSNIAKATEFGIAEDNIFPMWDWVGGRYSLWSAIGLPIALSLGFDNFEELLSGAYEMDVHFKTAPLEENLPAILGLLGVWYINFFGAQSHVLLPYDHYLRAFPAYVQQLDMESNGKSATPSGEYLDYETGPVIWGGEGTNGQHAFHQLIHQGKVLIPADFMLPLHSQHEVSNHHAMLASNCFGQTQALMQGKTEDEVRAELLAKGVSEEAIAKEIPQRVFEGNKPSNTLLFSKLTPKTLGNLIALYEHKVFVQGIVWGINSFDQWGVELGKVLGNDVLAKLEDSSIALDGDSSTNALIEKFRNR
ncbi:glucose-6-phosphate isomerase [Saccharobesus litoralis]|uniref:Glucose-6-phosphate isomerase n=1 Tax=Saccharobesus litoralis TaxID=2172099 RepID=A0A2S0VVR7_9ALTE|nr:glucose-6-phosphate isomerase [Saccharobesus litoralis]AWB68200.1 glucose-6-phosphate isomerase [Saccharobesus litoralis]